MRFNLNYSLKPLSIGNLTVGYQFRNLDHNGDFIYERKNNDTQLFELVNEFSSEVNLKRTINKSFIQYNNRIKKLNLAAGLRLENMNRELYLKDKTKTFFKKNSLNFTRLFPSASINFEWAENLSLSLGYSKRIERTTTFKMNPFPEREHSETLEQGDPNLNPEFIDQIEFQINRKTKKGNTSFF